MKSKSAILHLFTRRWGSHGSLQSRFNHFKDGSGGAAVVLWQDKGNSCRLHAWNAVKGSVFQTDQDVVDFFVYEMPKEILHLDHWGFPGPGGQTDASHSDRLAGIRLP